MKKLMHFMKPYQPSLFAAIIFMAVNNFSALYLPAIVARIVNQGALTGDIKYVYKMGLIMLIVAISGGTAYILSAIYTSRATSCFARDVRKAVFIKAQQYSLNDLQKFGTASMITRCTNDITIIQRSMTMILQMLLPAPIMAIVGLILTFRTNIAMGFLMSGIIVFISLIAYIIGRKAIPLFRHMQNKMDHITRVLREIITGVRVIRAFNKEDFENKRFKRSSEDYCDIAIQTNKIFAILLPILTLLTNLGILTILWFAGMKVTDGSMQIGNIFALIEYLTIILFTGTMAILVFMEIPRAQSCAERLNEVLELAPEITDYEIENNIPRDFHAQLEFRHVTFSYPNAEKPVLKDISFSSNPGEITAIIGGTGSGKSTIVNLIPRFFDTQSGEILIDGVNIRKYSQAQLRDKIGFIPQKAFLFRGTIESNLQYGNRTANLSKMKQAAKTAQAHSFISEMEESYKSFVAQAGSNLSGGQKQRLAIARALVKDAEVYIFDDSFSALDFKTDALIREALHRELKNSTTIIVAQRVSTIMNADRILVLNEGCIVGIGTHAELLESCPLYQQIAASQLSENELIQQII